MTLLLIAFLLAAGCSSPTRDLAKNEVVERMRGFEVEETKRRLAVLEQLVARAELERARIESNPEAPEPTLDVLVLSGGGPFGAFGAGVLRGWGEIDDPEWERPEFDMVTGVSVGALIAPFAFLGDDESVGQVSELFKSVDDDWAVRKRTLAILPTNDSFYDPSPLREFVREQLDDELLERLAQAGREHRQVAIAATNLDLGRLQVWDAAQLLAEALDEDMRREIAGDRLSNGLNASSAIPGVFPPITDRNGFLYADGGIIEPLFFNGAGDILEKLAERLRRAEEEEGAPRVRIRVWAIANMRLWGDIGVIGPSWPSVASRSIDLMTRSMVRSGLTSLVKSKRIVNDQDPDRVQFLFMAVPNNFVNKAPGKMFDREVMTELEAIGEQMGRDPGKWRNAVPSG